MAKRGHKKAKKACTTGKGKLKKGWRLAKGGRCVAAKKK